MIEKVSPKSFNLKYRHVFIKNVETKRYLFCDGKRIKRSRGSEKSWQASSGFKSPNILGTDANYYNRAVWKISPDGDNFIIKNIVTKRYLFSDGEPIQGYRGMEKGWKASSGFESPKVVGTDDNYDNRALWQIYKNDENYIIENLVTKRYLFSDGKPIEGSRGSEGSWKASSDFERPKIVGADGNYYNRALWKITKFPKTLKEFLSNRVI